MKNHGDISSWRSIQTIGLLLLSLQVLLSGVILFRIIKLQESLSPENTTPILNKQYTDISTGDYPPLGDENAKITIVEFLDYQCPYCLEATKITMQLLDEYPEQIKVYFRDFPLQNIHPEAMPSAIAARCANKQNQFWSYNEALFLNQETLSDQTRDSIALDLDLNMDQFAECINSQATLADIQDEVNEGEKIDVKGTPTFFINGYRVGGIDIEKIQMLIETELSK